MMPYTAEISRTNPSCFLFLIDQSGSMSDPFSGATGKAKADALADGINKLLQNLVIKCTKSEGVRDYYEIGVVGYGGNKGVGPAFLGDLKEQDLVPLSKVANNPARVEERVKKIDDGAGGLIDQTIKFPVWFDSIADNGTPMCEGLRYAQRVLQGWVGLHQASYPPTVINISDGEAGDGDPEPIALGITQMGTSDGNVLLFNCHVSSHSAAPIQYPDREDALPDQFAKSLFRMSSVLPPGLLDAARSEGFAVSDRSRGFVFNAELVDLIRFLDIGTRPSNLR
jgi:hypothetical protein